MTLKDYTESVNSFRADTAAWGGLDPYKHYVATENGGWAETCDNQENGIDLSWAFGLPADEIDCNAHYLAAYEEELRLAEDDELDEDQRRMMWEKFEDCVVNSEGHIFCDQWSAIVNLMDDEIREQVASEITPCTKQEFFFAYEKAHAEKHGEPWELSKSNPVW